MRATIITIGDELLIGQVVDTNSAWMAQRLNECGIALYEIISVHDDRDHIIDALNRALYTSDIVLTTGGLGPTKDDITKHVLCDYFGTHLVESADVRAHVEALYVNRPDVLNRLTATQWQVPESATILQNRVGSAPLMVFRGEDEHVVCCMPGVPYEMEIAMREQILPYLKEHFQLSESIAHRTLMVSGIPESSLAMLIEDWEEALCKHLHLAYLPKDGTIRLRLSAYTEEGVAALDNAFTELKGLVRTYLVADEDKPIECLVGDQLRARGATIATAESCTGGKLASLLNKHAGSSAFYMGSVVAYDNCIKRDVLHVREDDLAQYGAVSESVVRQMAEGVRALMGTDYAIATSGIAGPDGGTAEKPVGTVWIAWATPEGTYAECFHLGKLREQITDRACVRALVRMLNILK